jgi:hypothetical protein
MILRKRKETGILKEKELDRFRWRTRFERGYENPESKTSSIHP